MVTNRKGKIGYFYYNLFLGLASFLIIPYFIIRNMVLRRPVFPYFRSISKNELKKLGDKPVIWIQAVSVGETVVSHIILGELRKLLPDFSIILTTTTPTGQEMAKKLFGDEFLITYFPFDIPFFVKRFIRQIQPELFIMTETEIWPNAIRCSKEFGSKVAIVNGFISDHSYQRYQKFKPFLTEVFNQVDLLAMQSAEYANRIGQLGAPLERIQVTGNAKFDQKYPEYPEELLSHFLNHYGWSKHRPIFTAASTHRGEEEIIIEAYLKMIAEEPVYLILAPRHPERANEVIAILKDKNLEFTRRSETQVIRATNILLLDTFGELGLAYALADLILVGGSLVDIGGHNVLEAAAQSKPVMYGPYMHKARESKLLLEMVDAGFAVKNSEEIVARSKELLKDPELYLKRANAAREAVFSNKGAAENTARLAAQLVREL